MLAAAGALLLAGAIAVWLGRGMAKPIRALETAMRDISSGKREIVVPGAGRKDEIGSMAKAVEIFKDGLIESDRLRANQEEQRAAAGLERRNMMAALATRFETGVGSVVEAVGSAATELRTTAQSMAATADQATRQTATVAAASEEATQSAQAVAAASRSSTPRSRDRPAGQSIRQDRRRRRQPGQRRQLRGAEPGGRRRRKSATSSS